MIFKSFQILAITLLTVPFISFIATRRQENAVGNAEYAVANARIQLHFFRLFDSSFGSTEAYSVVPSKTNPSNFELLNENDDRDQFKKEIDRHNAFFETVVTHSQCMEQIFPVLFMKYLALTYTESFATGALFFKQTGKNDQAIACKQVSDILYWFATIKTEAIVSKTKKLIGQKWQTMEAEFKKVTRAAENYHKFIYNNRILPYESTKLFRSRSSDQKIYSNFIGTAKREIRQYVEKLDSFVNTIKYTPDTEYSSWKSDHWEPYHVSLKIWAQSSSIIKMLTTNIENNSRFKSLINKIQSSIVVVIRSLELNKLIWKKYITKEEVLNLAHNIQDKTLLWDFQVNSTKVDNKPTYFFREVPLAEMAAMYWSKVDAENKLQTRGDNMTVINKKPQSEEIEFFNLNDAFRMMMNENYWFPFATKVSGSESKKQSETKDSNSRSNRNTSKPIEPQDENNKSFDVSRIFPSLKKKELIPDEKLEHQKNVKQPQMKTFNNIRDSKQNQASTSQHQKTNETRKTSNANNEQPNKLSYDSEGGVYDLSQMSPKTNSVPTENTYSQTDKSQVKRPVKKHSNDKVDSKPDQAIFINQPQKKNTEEQNDKKKSNLPKASDSNSRSGKDLWNLVDPHAVAKLSQKSENKNVNEKDNKNMKSLSPVFKIFTLSPGTNDMYSSTNNSQSHEMKQEPMNFDSKQNQMDSKLESNTREKTSSGYKKQPKAYTFNNNDESFNVHEIMDIFNSIDSSIDENAHSQPNINNVKQPQQNINSKQMRNDSKSQNSPNERNFSGHKEQPKTNIFNMNNENFNINNLFEFLNKDESARSNNQPNFEAKKSQSQAIGGNDFLTKLMKNLNFMPIGNEYSTSFDIPTNSVSRGNHDESRKRNSLPFGEYDVNGFTPSWRSLFT